MLNNYTMHPLPVTSRDEVTSSLYRWCAYLLLQVWLKHIEMKIIMMIEEEKRLRSYDSSDSLFIFDFNVQILWESNKNNNRHFFLEQRLVQMFWLIVLCTKSNAQDASHKESDFCPVWTKPLHEIVYYWRHFYTTQHMESWFPCSQRNPLWSTRFQACSQEQSKETSSEWFEAAVVIYRHFRKYAYSIDATLMSVW